MKITSPAFYDHSAMPKKYTCDGANVNPPLSITGVPAEAEGLVLIVTDPDASSEDFVHWVVWNIDPSTEIIEEGMLPVGAISGINDFGIPGWGGPCPPSGTHRYEFHVYALDSIVELDAQSNKTDVRSYMNGSILDQAVVTGLYSKH